MAREPKYGATLNGWERLLASMEANPEDFKTLEDHRAKLKSMLDTARQASAQQAAMDAAKQEATRNLQSLLVEGRKLATFLRGGVKQRYGDRSEKLVEFGLAPFRAKAKAKSDQKPPEQKPPATPPPTPTPHPTTA
ncbi:MAG TPA: hypothetical protein VGP73_12010 [Thermoanaerobaculia bacterium]